MIEYMSILWNKNNPESCSSNFDIAPGIPNISTIQPLLALLPFYTGFSTLLQLISFLNNPTSLYLHLFIIDRALSSSKYRGAVNSHKYFLVGLIEVPTYETHRRIMPNIICNILLWNTNDKFSNSIAHRIQYSPLWIFFLYHKTCKRWNPEC